MAPGDKINVTLDADTVAQAREQLGEPFVGLDDAAVVERALDAYLLRRLMQSTQAAAELTAEEAERVAYEELRASRRERRDARDPGRRGGSFSRGAKTPDAALYVISRARPSV